MAEGKNFFGISEDRERKNLKFLEGEARGDKMTDYSLAEYEGDLGLSNADLLKIAKEGGEILDLGAGCCHFALDCQDELGIDNIYSVEPNVEKLPSYARLNKDQLKDRLKDHLVEVDVKKGLPFLEDKFKLILVHCGAISYADAELPALVMLKEAIRVLAPGGEIRFWPVQEANLSNKDFDKIFVFDKLAPNGFGVAVLEAADEQIKLGEYFNTLLKDLEVSGEFEIEFGTGSRYNYLVIKKLEDKKDE